MEEKVAALTDNSDDARQKAVREAERLAKEVRPRGERPNQCRGPLDAPSADEIRLRSARACIMFGISSRS